MKNILLIVFLSSFFYFNGQSQVISNYYCDSLLVSLSQDQDVLDMYEVDELVRYYIEEPEHLIKISIVQYNSYRIYMNAPTELSQNRQEDFLQEFNIRKYERKRKLNERTELQFEKHGITIELLSVNELNSLIEGKLQESNSYILTSFPVNDPQTNYNNKSDWALDYPEIAQLLNL